MFNLDGSETCWLIYADWLDDHDQPEKACLIRGQIGDKRPEDYFDFKENDLVGYDLAIAIKSVFTGCVGSDNKYGIFGENPRFFANIQYFVGGGDFKVGGRHGF